MISRLHRNYWIKSGITNIVQDGAGLVLSFGAFYFLIRILSKADFGAWILFISTTTIMEFARSGLVSKSLIMYLSSTPKDAHGSIIGVSSLINLLLTAIIAVACVAFAPFAADLWDSPQLVSLFHVYIIGFAASAILVQFNAIEQAYLSFQGIFLGNIIRQVTLFGVIFFHFYTRTNATLLTLVYAMIIGIVAATAVSWIFVKDKLAFSCSFRDGWFRKMLNYGKYSFGTSMSSIISGSIDQMMTGGMISNASAGAYNIAVRINNLMNIPANAMSTIVFPQSARRQEEDNSGGTKHLYEKSVGVTLAMLLPAIILVFAFAEPIVHFIGGQSYTETIPLLRITVLQAFFLPYTKQFGTILESTGRVKLNFFVTAASLVINISLNYLFIKQWGITGAAYAVLGSYILLFVATQFILKRLFETRVGNTWKFARASYAELWRKLRSS